MEQPLADALNNVADAVRSVKELGSLDKRIALIEQKMEERNETNSREHGEIKDTLEKIFKRLDRWAPPWLLILAPIATGTIMFLLGLLVRRGG